jgi:hypothetical protein
VQPYLAAIDLGDLVKFAVFFFVVVLPIVRTIMEAVKARQAEAARREEQGTSAGAEPESAGDADEDAARRAWEALMRGEEPVREVNEAPPPPAPPMVAPVSRRVEVRSVEGPSSEGASSEGESYEEQLEAKGEEQLDEEEAALVFNQRLLDEERARREAELTRRVASVPAERPPLDVAVRRTQARPQLLGSREELRRAVLSAEILGRPVALRDH